MISLHLSNINYNFRGDSFTQCHVSGVQSVANIMADFFLILHFVFFILAHLISRGVLVLLILRHKVIHVALGLGELHLIHPLSGVPVEEGLAAEHGCELLRDPPEKLLDGRAVADEGGGHLEATGWDVANGRLDIVGNPFNKVAAVLVLHAQHLLVHFLH